MHFLGRTFLNSAFLGDEFSADFKGLNSTLIAVTCPTGVLDLLVGPRDRLKCGYKTTGVTIRTTDIGLFYSNRLNVIGLLY